MSNLTRPKIALCGLAICTGLIAAPLLSQAQGFRNHTAISSQPIRTVAATRSVGPSQVSITTQGGTRTIATNGVPSHEVGRFPNRGNPHQIAALSRVFTVTTTPHQTGRITPVGRGLIMGVGVNGIVFDPMAAEFYQGNPRSGWNYDALGGAVPLGLDENHAHVQPDGSYHYHGIPTGLLEQVGWRPTTHSPLIGWAADGFPIYALTGAPDGRVQSMQSSYRLRSGQRPSGASDPGGRYDGTFVEDYEYVAGLGDLDECNGAFTVSAEFPNGTYAYFLTEGFPVVPRCLSGTPDRSFQMARGPGQTGPRQGQGPRPQRP